VRCKIVEKELYGLNNQSTFLYLIMKTFIYFILFLFPSLSFSQWITQNSSTSTNLKSVYFIDENTGWACGLDLVLKTTDSGVSWNSQSLSGEFQSVFFINSSTGFLVGNSGIFYQSINGGVSWEDISISSNINLTSLNFSSGIGIVTGFGNIILKSVDSGNNWNSISQNFDYDFFSSFILDQNNFYVVGSEGSVIKTTDGGTSWIDLTFGMVNPFFTVQFINQNTGWIIGCCGMYFKTTDAGNSWTEEFYLTEGYTIHSSQFINENTGWIAADAGIIFRTTNSGESWYSQLTNTAFDLSSIFMLNENTGWAAGSSGTILKTTNGGGTGTPINIQNISEGIPDNYYLYQNYPNPFNPTTNIRFSLPVSQLIELKVFDLTGKEVAILVNEVLNAGEYIFQFSANNYQLTSGIYFYRLEINNFTQTKKLVLLK
jgi:photosystem II stability/assembly factor-like uncharacterized protein